MGHVSTNNRDMAWSEIEASPKFRVDHRVFSQIEILAAFHVMFHVQPHPCDCGWKLCISRYLWWSQKNEVGKLTNTCRLHSSVPCWTVARSLVCQVCVFQLKIWSQAIIMPSIANHLIRHHSAAVWHRRHPTCRGRPGTMVESTIVRFLLHRFGIIWKSKTQKTYGKTLSFCGIMWVSQIIRAGVSIEYVFSQLDYIA